MGLLDGKVVLITGAARGQGRAHAIASAAEGADVVLLDIGKQIGTVLYPLAKPEDLDETVRLVNDLDRRAVSIVGDVRSSADLDKAVAEGIEAFGKIDVLIANAGIWNYTSLAEMTEDQWREMIDVNLTGVWRSIRSVIPHMSERRQGSIVVTASVNAIESAVGYAHYVSAKHGVLGLMKATALEMAPFGVRCNAICPGTIDTGISNHPSIWEMVGGYAGAGPEVLVEFGYNYAALANTTIMPPSVIANAALFLNSDLAANITGVTLPVDAGHLLLPGYNHSPVRY